MFFRKHKEKQAYQNLSPTERLNDLFSNRVMSALSASDATYVKSKRALRFSNNLYVFEIAWDQNKFNTKAQTDTRFQMRRSLFSPKYRDWEKEFYDLPKRLTGQALDMSLVQKGHSFILTFENRDALTHEIAELIDGFITDYFSCFEAWDDRAIERLKQSNWIFKQTVPLTMTDFLILQDRHQEARECLANHDQWYQKFIAQGKNGGEGLNDIWGPPYYLRLNKLAESLD